jgi:hypothetical protein
VNEIEKNRRFNTKQRLLAQTTLVQNFAFLSALFWFDSFLYDIGLLLNKNVTMLSDKKNFSLTSSVRKEIEARKKCLSNRTKFQISVQP